MKKFNFMLLALLVIVFVPVAAKADVGIKDGNWELVSTVDMSAQVAGQATIVPKVTKTECITNVNPIANIQKMAKSFPGCSEPVLQKNGGTIDYSVSCNGDTAQMNMSGHFVYTGETMEGTANASSVVQGKTSNIKMHITGRYIGPC
jgi:hypothetical protein